MVDFYIQKEEIKFEQKSMEVGGGVKGESGGRKYGNGWSIWS